MTDQESLTGADNGSNRERKFLMLFIAGFIITLLGIVIITVAAVLSGGGSASFGGFILIGPIPIIFGAGPEATWLALFAMILGVISIVVFLIMRRKVERGSA